MYEVYGSGAITESKYCRTVDFRDLSNTFSVRKMQLLGGQRQPQDLLARQMLAHIPWCGLWPHKKNWGGLWPPKSSFSLTGKEQGRRLRQLRD